MTLKICTLAVHFAARRPLLKAKRAWMMLVFLKSEKRVVLWESVLQLLEFEAGCDTYVWSWLWWIFQNGVLKPCQPSNTLWILHLTTNGVEAKTLLWWLSPRSVGQILLHSQRYGFATRSTTHAWLVPSEGNSRPPASILLRLGLQQAHLERMVLCFFPLRRVTDVTESFKGSENQSTSQMYWPSLGSRKRPKALLLCPFLETCSHCHLLVVSGGQRLVPCFAFLRSHDLPHLQSGVPWWWSTEDVGQEQRSSSLKKQEKPVGLDVDWGNRMKNLPKISWESSMLTEIKNELKRPMLF